MGRRILLFGRRSRLLAGKLFFHFLALPARRAFDHQEDASMDAMPWGLYQIHCPEQPRVSCVRDSCCVRREGAVLKPNKNYNGPPMPLAEAKCQSTQQADVKGNEDQMPQSQLLATTQEHSKSTELVPPLVVVRKARLQRLRRLTKEEEAR